MDKKIAFYDKSEFVYSSLLENNFDIVKQELLNVISFEVSNNPLNSKWLAAHPDYVNGSKAVSWKTFEFLFFGIKKKSNIDKCPETFKIISEIPELITAQFSVMEPHTHIMPHKGYSKIILRNHLPLIVPPGNLCSLKVGNEIKYWEEKKLLIFDDSILHEAVNKSDNYRAVLMFDIAKPNCGYNSKEICEYKIKNIDDPFLLEIADKAKWMKWYEQGYFDE